MRYDYSKVLVVIPCRQGSKRFPGKNTAHFNGVPLVRNTIRTSKTAWLDNILVTTNDVDAITIAAAEGVRYMNRPEDLCTDDATTEAVIENAVQYAAYALEGPHLDFHTICLLQVTSPLLRPVSLQSAIDTYFRTKAKSIVAINSMYEPAGAFYIIDRELFMKNLSLYQDTGRLYMLPAEQCVDVDHPHQLKIANAVAFGRRA